MHSRFWRFMMTWMLTKYIIYLSLHPRHHRICWSLSDECYPRPKLTQPICNVSVSQHKCWGSAGWTEIRSKDLYDWANFFATQPSTVRQLFSETIKIVQMLLVPASAASAERTFSSLRRLKTNNDPKAAYTSCFAALSHSHRHCVVHIDIDQYI